MTSIKTPPLHIKFNNKQNPKAGFDLIKIEDLWEQEETKTTADQLHLVNFYILMFIESGKGVHNIDFIDYPCQKGTLLTIRKDQIHKFVKKGNIKGSLLLFTSDFLISYLEHLEAQKSLQLFNEHLSSPKINLEKKDFEELSKLIEKIKNEYYHINDSYSLGIIRSELHILITKLYRIKSKKKYLIYHQKYLDNFITFQELVEKNVHKTNSVQDYAQMIGVSTKTLNTITKNIVHKRAKEFIDEICIKKIKRLLINTVLPIKEIAYTLGFEETSNFYKYFKRKTKNTPEQFRKKFQ